MQQNQPLSAFSIAIVFIGSMIGAGFASGQELLQFFCVFGLWGLAGILLSTTLFALLGWVVISLARSKGTGAYERLIVPFESIRLYSTVQYLLAFFMFGICSVMISGAGALFSEQLSLPSLLGSTLIALLVFLTVSLGADGVIRSLSAVIPVVVAAAVIISLVVILHADTSIWSMQIVLPQLSMKGNWFTSALLFVSYNTLGAVTILAPLGVRARTGRSVALGAVLGGVSLGCMALCICVAILLFFPQAGTAALPMVALAHSIHPVLGYLYSAVLFLGIYCSAVGCLLACTMRITHIRSLHGRPFIALLCAVALLGSAVGFSSLINFVYPITGYAGLLFIAGILYNFVKLRRSLPTEETLKLK